MKTENLISQQTSGHGIFSQIETGTQLLKQKRSTFTMFKKKIEQCDRRTA